MGSKSYSKGISWFDDCRIPHNEDLSIIREEKVLDTQNQGWGFKSVSRDNSGRFPANLLVCDDMLNDGVISKAGEYKGNGSKSGGIWNKSTGKPAGLEYGDKGSSSRYYDIDKWFDNIISE
jgi:hypothetical protein